MPVMHPMEDLHLGLSQNVPCVLPRAVHGNDPGVRVGHGGQMTHIPQIAGVEHQLETHPGLRAADMVGICITGGLARSGTVAGRRAPSAAAAGAGGAGRAVAPRAGIRAGRLLGVVRAGSTKTGRGHGRSFVHSFL